MTITCCRTPALLRPVPRHWFREDETTRSTVTSGEHVTVTLTCQTLSLVTQPGRGCLQEARPRTPLQTIALMMCSWGLSPKTEPFATQPLTVMEGSMALETGMILSTVANADLI